MLRKANALYLRACLAVALLLGTAVAAFATDPPPVVPASPVDVGTYATDGMGRMATALGVIVGVGFALLIVGVLIRWASTSLKRR